MNEEVLYMELNLKGNSNVYNYFYFMFVLLIHINKYTLTFVAYINISTLSV